MTDEKTHVENINKPYKPEREIDPKKLCGGRHLLRSVAHDYLNFGKSRMIFPSGLRVPFEAFDGVSEPIKTILECSDVEAARKAGSDVKIASIMPNVSEKILNIFGYYMNSTDRYESYMKSAACNSLMDLAEFANQYALTRWFVNIVDDIYGPLRETMIGDPCNEGIFSADVADLLTRLDKLAGAKAFNGLSSKMVDMVVEQIELISKKKICETIDMYSDEVKTLGCCHSKSSDNPRCDGKTCCKHIKARQTAALKELQRLYEAAAVQRNTKFDEAFLILMKLPDTMRDKLLRELIFSRTHGITFSSILKVKLSCKTESVVERMLNEHGDDSDGFLDLDTQ